MPLSRKGNRLRRVTCSGPPSQSGADPGVEPSELRLLGITFHMKQKDPYPLLKEQSHRHQETLKLLSLALVQKLSPPTGSVNSVCFLNHSLGPGILWLQLDLEGFCRLTFGAGANRGQDC